MIVRHSPGSRRLTLGADKVLRCARVRRRSARPQRHAAHCAEHDRPDLGGRCSHDAPPGFALSQQKRKRTEEPFGWAKTIGGLARPMLRGVARLRFKFTLTMAAYDLIRLPNLLGSPA
jgi:hypothetical protein